MRNLLFSPDPAEGGEPDAPPAAKAVLSGGKTEREAQLEAELQAERDTHAKTVKEKKDREFKISELEDELRKWKLPDPPKAPRSFLPDISKFFED